MRGQGITGAIHRLPLFLCGLLFESLAAPALARPPIALIRARVDGVPITYIALRLNDPRVTVRVDVCRQFPGSDEPFSAMIHRLHPLAAINGSYFSKATKCPIGDIVFHGRLLYSGRMGTALAITPDGQAIFKRVVWGHAADWTGYQTVLCCGPALVLNGDVDVQPQQEGFHDPHVMGATERMAVGYTRDGHLVLAHLCAPVTFPREAAVMKALGCIGAMNLDAGASTAMYYEGQFLVTPGRSLTNLLCVYAK